MKNKIIIGIIVALLIGGMIYKLAANKKTIDKNASPIDRSNVPVSVSTFEVNYFTVSTDYALPAVLDNNNTGIITATQPGKLATFNIEIGQHVTKGQLIGKIDSKQREIGIKSSDATIKKLEDDNNHISRTYIQKLITDGCIIVNGNSIKTNYKLRQGDSIELRIPDPKKLDVSAEKIDLNIIYEDDND